MTDVLPVSPGPGHPEIDTELHAVADFVHEEFDGQLDPRVVDECLGQVAARFEPSSRASGDSCRRGSRVWLWVGASRGYIQDMAKSYNCLLYTSPSPRDRQKSRMPSSA